MSATGVLPIRRVAGIAAAVASVALGPTSPAGPGDGEWVWPVGSGSAEVVAGLDPPAEPWRAGHRGVDLAAPEGSQVRAAGAGLVTYAGRIAGVGVVAVTHGDLRTTYQPVDPAVSAGRRVEPGEPIGALAAPGSHCAPQTCLHWGLIRGDTYLDPLALVPHGSGPRLLPLGRQAVEPGAAGGGARPEAVSAPARPQATVHRAAAGALAGLPGR
ncbi:MAG: murein hydrolase activator EnvC family protein [Actinomycetota bacterium]